MSVTLLLTCRDSKGSPEVLGGLITKDQGAPSSAHFCPAVLRQIPHCWDDSTHMEIELHMKYAAARKAFSPLALLQKSCGQFFARFVSVSTVCAHPEPPAVPGWLSLGSAISCGPSVQKAAWTPCAGSGSAPCAERAKSFTQSLSQPRGMELLGSVWSLQPSPGTQSYLSCRVKHPKAQIKSPPVQN